MSRAVTISCWSSSWRRRARRPAARVRGAQGPPGRRGLVCPRAQARSACGAAPHRRHHLADRRGAARHPARSRAAFPGRRGADLSDRRAGRGRRSGHRRGPRAGRAARRVRCADPGARRRLARGSLGLQRRARRARHRIAAATLSAPLVTGIGHEIDFTIADFVADVRAPTPSGAAELVVPDARALAASPRADLRPICGRDAPHARAASSARSRALLRRLEAAHPGARLRSAQARLLDLEGRLQFALQTHASAPTHAACRALARALQAVSPLATLERGFAVVTRSADGTLVTARRAAGRGRAPSMRASRTAACTPRCCRVAHERS